MDPPYTIATFMEKSSKLAVHVTSDPYFEAFVEHLRDLSVVPQTFSPVQYGHETVLVNINLSRTQIVLQPSMELAKEQGFKIVEACEFLEPGSPCYAPIDGLLEKLLCP